MREQVGGLLIGRLVDEVGEYSAVIDSDPYKY
jgi:hypothetical protein